MPATEVDKASARDDSNDLAAYARSLAQEASAQAHGGGATSSELPAALGGKPRAEWLRVLGVSDEPGLELRAERDLLGSGSLVVAVYRACEGCQELAKLNLRVFVLRERAGAFVRESSGRPRFASSMCPHDAGAPAGERSVELRPHPFALAPGRAAFALQLRCEISWPSGSGLETHLFLFEPRGAALAQMLTVLIDKRLHDRAGDIETVQRGELSPASTQHAGYLDLALRSTRERTKLSHDQTRAKRLDTTTSSAAYIWTGSQYIQK